ncbi:hypothetical protein Mal15_38720 [Stieleria maiorica]|uniref:Uncharacterized protein n=1 Tax=Stieleria maiorica TaxID=2795974 RepID=A0A5B9MJM6_9BACT|nr:hypothetical protein Mal15_38720 [Stieleria maiorica]
MCKAGRGGSVERFWGPGRELLTHKATAQTLMDWAFAHQRHHLSDPIDTLECTLHRAAP